MWRQGACAVTPHCIAQLSVALSRQVRPGRERTCRRRAGGTAGRPRRCGWTRALPRRPQRPRRAARARCSSRRPTRPCRRPAAEGTRSRRCRAALRAHSSTGHTVSVWYNSSSLALDISATPAAGSEQRWQTTQQTVAAWGLTERLQSTITNRSSEDGMAEPSADNSAKRSLDCHVPSRRVNLLGEKRVHVAHPASW